MSKITEYIQSLEGLDLRQSEIETLIEMVNKIETENTELNTSLKNISKNFQKSAGNHLTSRLKYDIIDNNKENRER